MRQSTVGTLLVLGAAAGFGTIGIFGELAIAADFPLERMLPVRFTLATGVILAVGVARGWSLPGSPRAWAATVGLGVVYTGLTVAYFESLHHLTAGLATTVLYTYPAFVVVLSAVVLREHVGRRTAAALACSLSGVALVVGLAGGGTLVGVALALGAALCYAVYTVGSRSVVGDISPGGLMTGALLGTTVSITAYSAVSGGLGLPTDGTQWAIVVGLAAVGTVLPLILFYEGVDRLPASRVGIVSTAEPVVTVLLGALLLDELITPAVVVGGALILTGVVLVQRQRAPGRPPSEPGDV